jgi:hypothetical protein
MLTEYSGSVAHPKPILNLKRQAHHSPRGVVLAVSASVQAFQFPAQSPRPSSSLESPADSACCGPEDSPGWWLFDLGGGLV